MLIGREQMVLSYKRARSSRAIKTNFCGNLCRHEGVTTGDYEPRHQPSGIEQSTGIFVE